MAHAKLFLFDGRMSVTQTTGITFLLDKWEAEMPDADDRWLAYMLATTHHETGRAMQPVRETFSPTDAGAIRILDRAFSAGKLPWVSEPYWRPDTEGRSWLGRGFVQITHKSNYVKLAAVTDPNLATDPTCAMEPATAANVLFQGMIQGLFTGKRLADFFSGDKEDWRNARSIINGIEKADLVASYGRQYYSCISYTTI